MLHLLISNLLNAEKPLFSDFRLPSRSSGDLRSSGILHSV